MSIKTSDLIKQVFKKAEFAPFFKGAIVLTPDDIEFSKDFTDDLELTQDDVDLILSQKWFMYRAAGHLRFVANLEKVSWDRWGSDIKPVGYLGMAVHEVLLDQIDEGDECFVQFKNGEWAKGSPLPPLVNGRWMIKKPVSKTGLEFIESDDN